LENYTIKQNINGRVYYINSENHLHRLDGPAIIWSSNSVAWFISHKKYSKYCHNIIVLFSVLEPERIILAKSNGDLWKIIK